MNYKSTYLFRYLLFLRAVQVKKPETVPRYVSSTVPLLIRCFLDFLNVNFFNLNGHFEATRHKTWTHSLKTDIQYTLQELQKSKSAKIGRFLYFQAIFSTCNSYSSWNTCWKPHFLDVVVELSNFYNYITKNGMYNKYSRRSRS